MIKGFSEPRIPEEPPTMAQAARELGFHLQDRGFLVGFGWGVANPNISESQRALLPHQLALIEQSVKRVEASRGAAVAVLMLQKDLRKRGYIEGFMAGIQTTLAPHETIATVKADVQKKLRILRPAIRANLNFLAPKPDDPS